MPRGIYPRTKEMKQRVASIAGSAPHEKRGLQASTKQMRKKIASLGGIARSKKFLKEGNLK